MKREPARRRWWTPWRRSTPLLDVIGPATRYLNAAGAYSSRYRDETSSEAKRADKRSE